MPFWKMAAARFNESYTKDYDDLLSTVGDYEVDFSSLSGEIRNNYTILDMELKEKFKELRARVFSFLSQFNS